MRSQTTENKYKVQPTRDPTSVMLGGHNKDKSKKRRHHGSLDTMDLMLWKVQILELDEMDSKIASSSIGAADTKGEGSVNVAMTITISSPPTVAFIKSSTELTTDSCRGCMNHSE